jgi:hypothetical protein
MADVRACQSPRLGYLAWHRDAARRTREGQRQAACGTCLRWQWPEDLCADALVVSPAEFERRRAAAEGASRPGY